MENKDECLNVPFSFQGGYVYHVLNRANADLVVFRKDEDYEAFLRVLTPSRACSRHAASRQLPHAQPLATHTVAAARRRAFRLLSLADAHAHAALHAHYRNVGRGHLYQGRYKSFPIAEDDHYFAVGRYVERNALRAGLVEKAEHWLFGSLDLRVGARPKGQALSAGPLELLEDWVRRVNRPQTEAELEALRRSVQPGRPYGSDAWVERTVRKPGLKSTLKARGRPKKEGDEKGS